MKSFKEYVKDRSAYHFEPTINSVHRSSLLVSEMPGTEVEITFLNHFLLKRDYQNVGCRITGIDPLGERIESRLFPITEPRIYKFNLSNDFDGRAANYLVEFFAAQNLFIPFPAVMINHKGNGFHNMVHVSNRVLNDVFEDDQINRYSVAESAIDVRIDDHTDTFFVFATGIQPLNDELHIELSGPDLCKNGKLHVDLPRMSSRLINLKEIFHELNVEEGMATLKIQQPKQFLFYGRLFSGIRYKDGSFSANHSYYDNSSEKEYWEDETQAYGVYPFMAHFDNRVRMYPIMAPGTLQVYITIHDKKGTTISRIHVGEIASPGPKTVDVSVNEVIAGESINLESVASFCVWAEGEMGSVPTRVNHQMIYRGNGLGSSINASLTNDAQLPVGNKTKISWGQLLIGGGYNAWLGMVFRGPGGEGDTVKITYYSIEGELESHQYELAACGAILLDMRKEFPRLNGNEMQYLWYSAECQRQDLNGWTVSQNLKTEHCSGEHSF